MKARVVVLQGTSSRSTQKREIPSAASGSESVDMFLQTEVEGFGYSIRGGIGYLAVVTLILFMTAVIGHTAFVLLYSVPASAWGDCHDGAGVWIEARQ